MRFTSWLRASVVLVAIASLLWASGISGPSISVVAYQGGTAVTSAAAAFVPFTGSTVGSSAEAAVQVPSPAPSTIRNMYVALGVAPGSGNTATFTWRDNGSSLSLTCTVSGAAKTCSDTTDVATVAAGDLLDIQVTVTGSIASVSYLGTASLWYAR